MSLILQLPPELAYRIAVAPSGHWLWMGKPNNMGYPYTYWAGRWRPTYCSIWEILVGPIPDGLELDHLCVTPMCVWPGHLEPVTHAENMRRAVERRKACWRGHDWTVPRNLRIRKNGRRECGECVRIADRKRPRPSPRRTPSSSAGLSFPS